MLAVIVSAPFPARLAAAQEAPGEWVEIRLERVVVLGPADLAGDLQLFAALHGPTLESALDDFGQLYGAYPPLPVNVRIYADLDQFQRLNAVLPPLGPGGYHAHLGSREIALILPLPEGALTTTQATNVMRYELNALFAAALAGEALPPGLEAGMGQYLQQPGPETQVAVDRVALASRTGRLLPWRDLFETEAIYRDHEVAFPQAMAVVAFLADSYGFEPLMALLRSIGAGRSYRNAFTEVYGRPMDRLELDWQAYLPLYLETRWQFHVLYHYDLEPLRAGLESGAYTQVHRALEAILPFLEETEQAAALAEAQALQATAAAGMAAGELVQAERSALQAGDLETTLALADEARAAYLALGDGRREEEIALYAARAQALLDLRAELAQAAAMVEAGRGDEAEPILLALSPQLQALGDSDSAAQIAALVDGLQAERVAAAAQAQARLDEQIRWAAGAALILLLHRGMMLLIGWRRRAPGVL